MTESMIKYQTTFEATENLPMIIAIGHGENADLVASFKDGGIDVALEGYTARAIYQPKSKWGTDDWYECPCEIVNDTVIAHWGNTYDNGDDAVKLFMHLVKNGKVAYPAIYQIKLFASPGFSPSAIEPIPETIDFAQYQLENAPWIPLAGNVTVTGDITTDHDLIHLRRDTITYKNLEVVNDHPSQFDGNFVFTFEEQYLDNLMDLDSGVIPVKISGTSASTGNPLIISAQLRLPTQDGVRVSWSIWTYMPIGNIAFYQDEGEDPLAGSASVNGDYGFSSHYNADTSAVVDVTENYIHNLDSVPYTVRNVTDKEVSSSTDSLDINQHEVLGITIRSSYQGENIYLGLPNNGQDKAVDFYVNVRNNADHTVRISLAMHSPAPWTMIGGNGDYDSGIWLVESGTTACIHFMETRTFGYGGRNQLLVIREGYDVVQMGQTITNNLPYSIREVTIGQGGIVYPVSREVVGVKFSDAQATSFSIQLPNPTDGKAVDFYVDICNNHDYSLPATLINTGWGVEPYRYYWRFAVDAGETLSSILAIKGQDTSSGYSRLHFSQIGFDITSNDPILNITKQELNIQNS